MILRRTSDFMWMKKKRIREYVFVKKKSNLFVLVGTRLKNEV